MDMKKLLMVLLFLSAAGLMQARNLSPFYKLGESNKSIIELSEELSATITENGFDVIGKYSPAKSENLFVICFTSNELKDLSLQFEDRGALASVMKVGLVKKDGKTIISLLNPEYMFLAYWGEQLKGQEASLKAMSEKVVKVFSSYGAPTPFGGELEADKLPAYHYMMMMPYFTDPDELAEFDSFEEGLKTIRANLAAGKGNTVEVFEQVFEGKEIAVFGVGLQNPETGEPHFLPIIGKDHVANMPYEIILQGKEATSLPGKYRIALYWPSLTMGTFMKINSTPGEIEDALEAICEE